MLRKTKCLVQVDPPPYALKVLTCQIISLPYLLTNSLVGIFFMLVFIHVLGVSGEKTYLNDFETSYSCYLQI